MTVCHCSRGIPLDSMISTERERKRKNGYQRCWAHCRFHQLQAEARPSLSSRPAGPHRTWPCHQPTGPGVAGRDRPAARSAGGVDSMVITFGAGPRKRKPRRWLVYRRCLDGARRNGDGTGPDRNRANYFWCPLTIRWGETIEQTAEHLMEPSGKGAQAR